MNFQNKALIFFCFSFVCALILIENLDLHSKHLSIVKQTRQTVTDNPTPAPTDNPTSVPSDNPAPVAIAKSNDNRITSFGPIINSTINEILQHVRRFPYIEYYASEKQMYFCSTPGDDIGNFLEAYWITRALAFWTNVTFIVPHSNNQTQVTKCKQSTKTFLMDSKHFIKYLPSVVTPTLNIIYSNESINWYSDILSWISTMPTPNICEPWPVECDTMFIFYNQIFMAAIQNETNEAITKYFIAKQDKQESVKSKPLIAPHLQNNTLYNNNSNTNNAESDHDHDIVIHIRCGDILNNNGFEYGFMKSKYYQFIISENVTNWKNKLTAKSKVWIISQLSKSSSRTYWNERDTIGKCTELVETLVEQNFKSLFDPATIVIIRNGTIESDYLKMINAPLFICSMSTFSLFAAVGHRANNNDRFAVLPMTGPWTDIDKYAASRDPNYDGNVLKNSALIPPNHIWINNEKLNLYITGHDVVQNKWNQNIQQFVGKLTT